MTFDYQQMLADREAGTKGEWSWEYESGEWPSESLEGDDSVLWYDFDLGFRFGEPSDARRIARVSQMEAEIIRLRKHLQIILDSKDLPASEGYFKQAVINEARAALKGEPG